MNSPANGEHRVERIAGRVWQSNTAGNNRYEQRYPATVTEIQCVTPPTGAHGIRSVVRTGTTRVGLGTLRPVHRVSLDLSASDGTARAGTAATARGTYQTPLFMPVGTRGAIKYLSAADYDRLGAEIVGAAFIIDLPELGGTKLLEADGLKVHALMAFEGH